MIFKARRGWLLAAAVGASFVGCGGPTREQDARVEEFCRKQMQLYKQLDSITDAAGLAYARPELDRLADECRTLDAEINAYPEATRNDLVKKHSAILDQVKAKRAALSDRLLAGTLPFEASQYVIIIARPVAR